jgi:hypothetical protein
MRSDNIKEKLNQVVEIVRKDCAPYLRSLKREGLKLPFIRGLRKPGDPVVGNLLYKQNTRPIPSRPPNVEDKLYDLFNEWLKKNHHNEQKNCLYVTNSPGFNVHGNRYYSIPIGNFSYTFIRHYDSGVWLSDTFEGWAKIHTTVHMGPGITRVKTADSEVQSKGVDFDQYSHLFETDRKLKEAYNKHFEVWIVCKSYYNFPVRHYQDWWTEYLLSRIFYIKRSNITKPDKMNISWRPEVKEDIINRINKTLI